MHFVLNGIIRINLSVKFRGEYFYALPALRILKNRTNFATKKLMMKYQRFLAVGRLEMNILHRRTTMMVLNVQRILRKLFKCLCAPFKPFISSFKT